MMLTKMMEDIYQVLFTGILLNSQENIIKLTTTKFLKTNLFEYRTMTRVTTWMSLSIKEIQSIRESTQLQT